MKMGPCKLYKYKPYKWPNVVVFMTKWKYSENPSGGTCTDGFKKVHRGLSLLLSTSFFFLRFMLKGKNHQIIHHFWNEKPTCGIYFCNFPKEQGCSHKFEHTKLGKQISSTSYVEKTNSHKLN